MRMLHTTTFSTSSHSLSGALPGPAARAALGWARRVSAAVAAPVPSGREAVPGGARASQSSGGFGTPGGAAGGMKLFIFTECGFEDY